MSTNPRLADLDMSVRLQNICWIYEFKTLDDLCRHTRAEFAALRHVGRVTLAEVEALLAKHGRQFYREGTGVPLHLRAETEAAVEALRVDLLAEPLREDDFRALCEQALRSMAADLRRIVEQLERQNPGYVVVVHRFIHDEFEFELVPKEPQ